MRIAIAGAGAVGRSIAGELLENGQPQEFRLPLSREALFTHFDFRADVPGVRLGAGNHLPARRIVAFLDEFHPED